MSATEADLVDQLADRMNRLAMIRIDPEKFHVERDDIAKTLRRLAKRLRDEPAPQRQGDHLTWRAQGRRWPRPNRPSSD